MKPTAFLSSALSALHRFRRRALAAAAVACAALVATLPAAEAPRFAHEESDLKPDPAARFGTLPNGLRYVVRANANPRARASLRLVVLAGSFMETDAQRGLAHFLEHMAFNGSRHFPGGTLVETLQRLGMSFGADTNASTNFDQTIYMLELPDAKAETLAEGLRIFSDYGQALDLAADKIEKERGIILSEKRARDSVAFRTYLAANEFAFGGTRIASRIPIGTEEVIRTAGRAEFVDFYDAWYRPERMAVVAVGDFDPAAVERQIVAEFSGIAARGPARPAPALGALPAEPGLRVRYHHEADAPNTTVTISTVTPYQHEADTAANRIKELPRQLALAMLNQRLGELSRREGAPFTSAAAGVSEDYNFVREGSIAAVCAPGQWKAALVALDTELRRALQHSFRPEELAETIANLRQGLEQGVRGAATRSSSGLANAIVASLTGPHVFSAPDQVQALLLPALEKITVAECRDALRALWAVRARNLFIAGNAPIAGDAVKAIAAAYEEAHALPVTAADRTATAAFAYTDFGTAGTVAAREHVEDLDLTLIRFANGVRLNLKKTDFAAGRVQVSVRFGGGLVSVPADKPGLGVLVNGTYMAGGLGKHSFDELRHLHAGKMVGGGFGIGEDAFVLGGTTNPQDLLPELRYLCAYLSDPAFRPEALRLYQQSIDQTFAALAHSVEAPFSTAVPILMAGGDARFGLPGKDVLLARTVDEAKTWLRAQCPAGPVEVAVVGDIDIDATVAAVAQTFGALPPRSPKPDQREGRRVSLPTAPIVKNFQVPTTIDRGVVQVWWPVPDGTDASRSRRLAVLKSVFEDRLRIRLREELGGTYSPSVQLSQSETFPGFGYLVVSVAVAPAQAAEFAAAITDVAAKLATGAVSDDEFQRAKQPILTAIRTTARRNDYWMAAVLAAAQEHPRYLERARNRDQDYQSIAREDIEKLAHDYLPPGRASRFVSVPTATK